MRILILGATGMVGQSVLRRIEANSSLSVVGTTTRRDSRTNLTRFCWPQDSLERLVDKVSPDVILNLAAKLDNKSIDIDDVAQQEMFALNSDLLSSLSLMSEKVKLIHMSTDGVFSGRNPPYTEESATDGEGIYAKSKIQGELNITNGKILRCSVIGRSPNPSISIPNLLLRQKQNAVMKISNNELWNGITSSAFAEFISSLLINNLLNSMNRIDEPSSRILLTREIEFLTQVWEKTSFGKIPSIEEMLERSDFSIA
jgi:dTDP-4-dehydrorhamnose reductase